MCDPEVRASNPGQHKTSTRPGGPDVRLRKSRPVILTACSGSQRSAAARKRGAVTGVHWEVCELLGGRIHGQGAPGSNIPLGKDGQCDTRAGDLR